jgi:hypothetical protein
LSPPLHTLSLSQSLYHCTVNININTVDIIICRTHRHKYRQVNPVITRSDISYFFFNPISEQKAYRIADFQEEKERATTPPCQI